MSFGATVRTDLLETHILVQHKLCREEHGMKYRLRHIFLAVFVAAILCAIVIAPAMRQKSSVHLLKSAGARVTISYDHDSTLWYVPSSLQNTIKQHAGIDFVYPVVAVSIGHAENTLTNEHMTAFRHLPRLRKLEIQSHSLTPSSLVHLAGLTELERLGLIYVPATDETLDHLKELKQLRSLNLFGANITGNGTERLTAFSKLEDLTLAELDLHGHLGFLRHTPNMSRLYLSYTNVDDSDLNELLQLKNLEELFLRQTQVSDEGVEVLARLPSLRRLELVGSNVTMEKSEVLRLFNHRLESLAVD